MNRLATIVVAGHSAVARTRVGYIEVQSNGPGRRHRSTKRGTVRGDFATRASCTAATYQCRVCEVLHEHRRARRHRLTTVCLACRLAGGVAMLLVLRRAAHRARHPCHWRSACGMLRHSARSRRVAASRMRRTGSAAGSGVEMHHERTGEQPGETAQPHVAKSKSAQRLLEATVERGCGWAGRHRTVRRTTDCERFPCAVCSTPSAATARRLQR